MAFVNKTAFEARITNNEWNELCNISGKFQASSAAADCSAGVLCVRSTKLPCEGFTGIDNENAWTMVAAASTTNLDTPIFACNPYDHPNIVRGANRYDVGTATLGLGVPAGEMGTFTEVVFDGKHFYRFGEGNFTAGVDDETYFTIGAGGLLVPTSDKPTTAGTPYFVLNGAGNFVEGNSESFGYYDLMACKVTV